MEINEDIKKRKTIKISKKIKRLSKQENLIVTLTF